MKQPTFLAGFAVLLAAAGCGKAAETAAAAKSPISESAMGGETQLARQEKGSPPIAPKEAPARAVIRSGSLSIRVESVEKAEDKVIEWVRQLGGYVESAVSTDLASATPQLAMKLRVPSSQFDAAMEGLEKLGLRTAKSVRSEDVTANLIDLGARLKIMKAQEEVFRRMMSQTKSSQDLMETQEKVMNLRASIESLEAQQKSLSQLAALSVIELTLQQSAQGAIAATTDPNWASEAWGASMSTLGNCGRVIGSGFIWTLVFAPIWLPALWLARSFWRKNSPSPGPKFDLSG